jgi:hypothetical protein
MGKKAVLRGLEQSQTLVACACSGDGAGAGARVRRCRVRRFAAQVLGLPGAPRGTLEESASRADGRSRCFTACTGCVQTWPPALRCTSWSTMRTGRCTLAALPRVPASTARAAPVALAVATRPHLPADGRGCSKRSPVLEVADILDPGRPLRFVHPMVRAGIYEGLSTGQVLGGLRSAARLLGAVVRRERASSRALARQ